MINIITYAILALLVLLSGFFCLQKTYVTNPLKSKTTFLYGGYAKIFSLIAFVFFAALYAFVDKEDFVAPINIFQLLVPLLLLGVICFYSKEYVKIIICMIIALLSPVEAVSNYLPDVNLYFNKLIVFAFLYGFSFLFEKQKTLSGVLFIELACLGGVLFLLYFLSGMPYLYSLFGLIIFLLSSQMFSFAKMPIKIEMLDKDYKFLAIFCGWFIVLAASEYCLYPAMAVFSMVFINAIFKIILKVKNFNFKENYDIYMLCINQAHITEKDLYYFIIKSYILLGIIAIASTQVENPSSVFVVSFALGGWLLYKSYNLYEKKASWKNMYNDFREKIEDVKDDKKN